MTTTTTSTTTSTTTTISTTTTTTTTTITTTTRITTTTTTTTTTKTTTTTTTTTDTTTTESISDWYQDFFSKLLADNEKKNPRSTTSTTTTEAAIESQDDHDHDHHHDHHHDAQHFDELAKGKKSLPPAPVGNLGLSITDSGLDEAARQFVTINNQVGFQLYRKLVKNSPQDNLLFSPVSATSSLAMLFLGARGLTSWQINELLELDKIITFNPHLLYKNISDTLSVSETENFSSSASKNILVSKVELYKSIRVTLTASIPLGC